MGVIGLHKGQVLITVGVFLISGLLGLGLQS